MLLYFLNMFKPNRKVSHITSYDNTTKVSARVSATYNVTLLQGHKNLLNLLLYAEIKLINLFWKILHSTFGNKTVFPTQKK